MQNFAQIVPAELPRWGLNAIDVAKCSDFGHAEGYILEMVQDTASGMISD